jgi:hypothetical protein
VTRTLNRVLAPGRDAVQALRERSLRRRLGSSPIRPVWKRDFDLLARQHAYLRGRWRYMAVAADVVGDLILRHGLRTALELGPKIQPLVVGADLMDLEPRPELDSAARVLCHDATKVPWPIADGRYDLFVALQVFEHLGDQQAAAFAEVRRIARTAVISVPIGWTTVDPSDLHYGISHETVLSWFAPTAPTRVVVGNRGPRTRLIYVFEGLAEAGGSGS